ncbi:MAG: hypothetical protein K6E98_11380 [Lachnospiraceae bacterium]|nr:hypothetical protein [Lachnospiraceae bacterium]
MNLVDVYNLISSVGHEELNNLISKIEELFPVIGSRINKSNITEFITAQYIRYGYFGESGCVYAYGAGNMAKENLPKLKKVRRVLTVYDQYTCADKVCDIQIERPKEINKTDFPIIIFVDDFAARRKIRLLLREKGFKYIYYFREYLDVIDKISQLNITEDFNSDNDVVRTVLDGFLNRYEIIGSELSKVNYSAVLKSFDEIKLDFCTENKEKLKIDLSNSLLLNECAEQVYKACDELCEDAISNLMEFSLKLEIFLREALKDGVKTKYRPIRMQDDIPYDMFSVFETMKVLILDMISSDGRLRIIDYLLGVSEKSVYMMTIKCYFLCADSRYEEALELSRKAVYLEPNNMLANETLYQVCIKCMEKGIKVEEPMPKYDLKDRFCWSGMNFAWCGGFDLSAEQPIWGPCFRPLQCSALPNGEFWSGEEWKEFRKSLLDGSFKYCQKNQCPNIVAGWLPRKADCHDPLIRNMFDGNDSVVPDLQELHLSYDAHCNLCCPSCRKEFRTNSKEEEEKLDKLYDAHLKKLIKNSKHLCLSGCGEAMLSPHSKRILQSFSGEEYSKLFVELRTNVTAINERNWKSLGDGAKRIRHIAASIDSCSKPNFEKLRYPAKWDIVLQNLEFIKSLRDNKDIDILEFHVVVQDENIDELTGIIRMAADFNADVVTFSKIINWMGMSPEEYNRRNPFIPDNPNYVKLKKVTEEIINIRNEIELGIWQYSKKKMYINMHFIPDPNNSYDVIRNGPLKIR